MDKKLVILLMKSDQLSPPHGKKKDCDTLAMKDHETNQM